MSSERQPPDDRELEDFLAGRHPAGKAYREASQHETAPRELDEAILDFARQAARRPLRRRPRWLQPVALAATLALSVGVLMNLWRDPATRGQLAPGQGAPLEERRRDATDEAAPAAPSSRPVVEPSAAAKAAPPPLQDGAGAGSAAKAAPEPPEEKAKRALSLEAPAMSAAQPQSGADDDAGGSLGAPAESRDEAVMAREPAPPPAAPPAPSAALPEPSAPGDPRYRFYQHLEREDVPGTASAARKQESAPSSAVRRESGASSGTLGPASPPQDHGATADMNVPAAPPVWIEQIRARRARGDEDGARALLKRFREVYPDEPLPEDLLKLDARPEP